METKAAAALIILALFLAVILMTFVTVRDHSPKVGTYPTEVTR